MYSSRFLTPKYQIYLFFRKFPWFHAFRKEIRGKNGTRIHLLAVATIINGKSQDYKNECQEWGIACIAIYFYFGIFGKGEITEKLRKKGIQGRSVPFSVYFFPNQNHLGSDDFMADSTKYKSKYQTF